MESSNDRLVLVTGASGYVAGHVIKVLLEANYRVRGTVRKIADKKKYEHLLALPGASAQNLEFFEADLTSSNGWEEACKNCTFAMHVASPFPSKVVNNEELELIKPAVEGTLNVLRAALKAGVKKVIVTSSVAAIMAGHDTETCQKGLTEETWSNLSVAKGYERSKTLAEKAAWDFHNQNKDKIEIACINPSLILGPIMSKNAFTSAEIVEKLLKSEFPALPRLSFGVVDVRDVARAHLLALENTKSNGQRYIVCEKTLWMADIAEILKSEFKKHGYSITTTVVSKFFVKMLSIFYKQARLIVGLIDIFYRFDNSKSINELGLKYTPIEQSIVEMGYSLIDNGVVKDKRKNKPSNPSL